MEYLVGNKQIFLDYLDGIKKTDRVAVLAHADLDGVASAIILDKVLHSKKRKIKDLKFVQLKVGLFEELFSELTRKKINKVILCDLSVNSDMAGFEELRKKFDTFLIDHHPYEIKGKNIIKTKTPDCAAFTIYDLSKEIYDLSRLEWLVCATMVSEFSFNDEFNFRFIQQHYPNVTKENIHDSEPGEWSKNISSSLVYFAGKEKKIFNLIKKNKLRSFGKYRKIIDSEIAKFVDSFRKDAEYYPEKNLYFYFAAPKYGVTSIVTTILSLEQPDKSFVFVSPQLDNPDYYKVSSRSNGGREDMNILMKKGIDGLENANGGGHPRASGARFMKKDFEKFKKNLLGK